MKRTFIASAIIGLGMCGVQLGGCGGDEQKNPLNSPPPRTEAQPADCVLYRTTFMAYHQVRYDSSAFWFRCYELR